MRSNYKIVKINRLLTGEDSFITINVFLCHFLCTTLWTPHGTRGYFWQFLQPLPAAFLLYCSEVMNYVLLTQPFRRDHPILYITDFITVALWYCLCFVFASIGQGNICLISLLSFSKRQWTFKKKVEGGVTTGYSIQQHSNIVVVVNIMMFFKLL